MSTIMCRVLNLHMQWWLLTRPSPILLLYLWWGVQPWRVVTMKEQDEDDGRTGVRRTGVRRTGLWRHASVRMPELGTTFVCVCPGPASAIVPPLKLTIYSEYITQITRRKLSSPCRLFKTARIDNKWEHKILHYPNAFCRLFREEMQCMHFNSFNCGR